MFKQELSKVIFKSSLIANTTASACGTLTLALENQLFNSDSLILEFLAGGAGVWTSQNASFIYSASKISNIPKLSKEMTKLLSNQAIFSHLSLSFAILTPLISKEYNLNSIEAGAITGSILTPTFATISAYGWEKTHEKVDQIIEDIKYTPSIYYTTQKYKSTKSSIRTKLDQLISHNKSF